MTALLHLDGVSGRYAAVTALHPLTLEVAAGARHAVIGPNGAGKSTLLHLIAGSLPAAAGTIGLAGRDITRLRPAARARTGIARTFQHPGVVDALTAGDNVRLALPRRPRLRRGLRAAAVVDALARVGLADQVARPAGQLPYGQRRLLELGMALAAQPRLLLLDEPSAGLGPAEVDQLTALVTGLPATTTVVLVDHHLPLIWAVADTVTVLHHGRHLSTGTPAAVQADPHVRDAYLQPPTHPATDTAGRRGRPRTSASTLLQVRGLRAGYHGADVLHDLDLDLSRGAVHALLGRNGAGKTTLLNTIAGLHRPRAGHLRLDGHDLHPATPPATRRRIAIVPQGRRLFAQLTVGEHLLFAARRRPSGQPCDLDAVAALTAPLEAARGRYPRQLSGGQQQFLALARALLTGPDLLLLDEPTEGLAPSIVADLRTILGRLADTGLTVLLAEQNLTFALDLASHLTVLDDGHTALQTDLAALDNPATLATVHTRLGITPGAHP